MLICDTFVYVITLTAAFVFNYELYSGFSEQSLTYRLLPVFTVHIQSLGNIFQVFRLQKYSETL